MLKLFIKYEKHTQATVFLSKIPVKKLILDRADKIL